ncbi:YbbR-like domain-containing protein [Haloimpatiens sp. FM7315]|uniref:CdaR family protein n=1 Tax=Haloimpatiens sp. FM7315 TaxID=3298609 RepID=UPI00370CEB54
MDKGRKKDFLIKFCCFIAAFGLWLYIYNIENPIKTTIVKNVGVSITNKDVLSQYNLVELPNQDYSVNLTVKGATSKIYSLKPSQFKLEADLSTYALKKGKMQIPVIIKESPEDVTIINPETLWVEIEIDKYTQKNVPVKSVVKGKVKEGYNALEPLISPNTVVVGGPSKYVSLVDHANVSINFNNDENNIENTYTLIPVDSSGKEVDHVKVEPKEVSVKIPLDKTKYVPVEANLKSTGDKTVSSLTIIPDNVAISGEPEVLKKITKLTTEEIDLSRISKDGIVEAKLKVPDNIKLVDVEEKVKIKVTFETAMQKKILVDIKISNLDEKFNAELKTKQISVLVSGNKEIINLLKDGDIEAYVDLKNLKEGSYDLPLNIKKPDNIDKVSYDPQKVSVSIKPKEESEVTNAN